MELPDLACEQQSDNQQGRRAEIERVRDEK
jgi:hypothetical protein